MDRFLRSLTFKIGTIIILIEVAVLSMGGLFYIRRFSNAVDNQAENKVKLPGTLMNAGYLSLASLADQDAMKDLVGEELVESWAVSPDGKIFASLNPEYQNINIIDIPEIIIAFI